MKRINKKDKNLLLCPMFHRVIFKIIGVIIIISISLLYLLAPTFWNKREMLMGSITYAGFWMITRAGIEKVNNNEKS